MSLNLAPYHSAMRIGQGFNSYTHDICMNDAVIYDSSKPGGDHFSGDTKQISQIVTYCTRHVEKMSEVTDAMNVSAALSIKSATFGGGLSGSYVDSDKFKESSINFFVQVSVVNQVIMAEDVTKFNPLPTGKGSSGSFTKIYGDCFISGFIEGGELDALVSIKVTDQTTIKDIKVALEANFGKGGVGGELKGAFGKNSDKSLQDSETTITVNWNGGGEIKPADVPWSIEALTKVAAAFPNNVAQCPQRTYAILTKYEQLRSWQEQSDRVSPLDYEMASYYTNDLLDAMMAYKNIWKQIHLDIVAYEFGQVELTKADPNKIKKPKDGNGKGDKTEVGRNHYIEDIIQVARENGGEDVDRVIALAKSLHAANLSGTHGTPKQIEYPPNEFVPYEPDEYGLQKARKDCRLEMLKICAEVDAIEANPLLALDPDRDIKSIQPTTFRKLLPLKKSKEQKPNEPPPPSQAPKEMYEGDKNTLPSQIRQWYDQAAKEEKAKKWQMTKWAGDQSKHQPDEPPFQDYNELDASDMVTKVEVWTTKPPVAGKEHIIAYRLTYNNSDAKTIFRHHASRGKDVKDPPNSDEATLETWNVPAGDRITSVDLIAGKYEYDAKVLGFIRFTTEKGDIRALGHQEGIKEAETTSTKALSPAYSFMGFWAEHGAAFDRVGVFYAQDK